MISFLGQFNKFENGLEMIDDVILVKCFIDSKIEYEYVHKIIQRKNKINKKNSESNKRLNVLMLVIDSVSNLHFKRALPKTLEFLKAQQNFFSFEKYHSTGPSTLYNIVPMLSGK